MNRLSKISSHINCLCLFTSDGITQETNNVNKIALIALSLANYAKIITYINHQDEASKYPDEFQRSVGGVQYKQSRIVKGTYNLRLS